MNNFNIHRFGKLLRYDIISNYRFYLVQILGIFLWHFFSQLGIVYFSTRYWDRNPASCSSLPIDAVTSTCVTAYFAISFLLLVAMMARTFSVLSTKPKRISYLMLPASNLEKFVSRLLIYSVGFIIINPLVFIVADVLRAVALVAMPVHLPLVFITIPAFISDITQGFCSFYTHGVAEVGQFKFYYYMLYFACFCLFNCMIYVLGSLYFKKNAFLKTTAIMMLVGFIIANILPMSMVDYDGKHSYFGGMIYLTLFVAILLLCYRKFTRTTVIKKKLWRI